MSSALHLAISEDASKLIVRHQTYASLLAEQARRVARRTGLPPQWTVRTPTYWALDDGFDPYRVRPRAAGIARSIGAALRRGRYEPRPAVLYEVPRKDGSPRVVSVFQVADNALSRLVYKNLLAKNASQFSSRCYAYREDLTRHDAVSHVAAEFRGSSRLFVAEYDFKKYFDNIAHDHLRRLLGDRRFYITRREAAVIESFLVAPRLSASSYPVGPRPGDRGIPQGTSISLFLANLAAYPLDRRLEQLGVGFVRFADDTLIWSPEYSRVCEAVDVLNETAFNMGVDLNLSKSEGVSILANPDEPAEFRKKEFVDFVGYRIGRGVVSIRESTLQNARRRVAQIVYTNLLEAVKVGLVVPARFGPPVDRDYVTMIYQLRRYLYGGLSEGKLARYLAGVAPRIHYRGLMSFYPLVNDDALLRRLDGWMLHTVWTSLRQRSRLLTGMGHVNLPKPHGLAKTPLLALRAPTSKGSMLDLRLPSFFRVARMLRKATRQYGPNVISHPQSAQYYIG